MMEEIQEGRAEKMKVSVRDRAIMLVLSLVGAVLILRPVIAFQSFSRGNFFIDNGFTKKAISHYERSVLLEPNSSDTFGWLGFSYMRDKQAGKAIEAYKRGLKINPKDKQIYSELGHVYYEKKDYRNAATNFEKTVDLDPCDLNAQNMQALSYLEMGEKDKAISVWQSILKKDPQYKPAQKNLKKLEAGQ